MTAAPDPRAVAEATMAGLKDPLAVMRLGVQKVEAVMLGAADAIEQLQSALAAALKERDEARRACRTRADYDLRCAGCGAAHNLDCSLPSEVWNKIADPSDLLCILCIDDRLVAKGLRCDEAEFYYVGSALSSKLYAESHGDVAHLTGLLAAAEPKAKALDALEAWIRSETGISAQFVEQQNRRIHAELHAYGEGLHTADGPDLSAAITQALDAASGGSVVA